MSKVVVSAQFDLLRFANVERCPGSFFPLEHWGPMQWGCALGGEAGEALNVLKKIERDGWSDEKIDAAMSELADVVIYADMTSARLGRELWPAVVKKFNEVSDRVGSQIKLNVQDEAVRVIEFALAIDDHYDMREFLADWAHGDLSAWPEFVRGDRRPDPAA